MDSLQALAMTESTSSSSARKRQREIRDAVLPCLGHAGTNAGHVDRTLQRLHQAGIVEKPPSKGSVRHRDYRIRKDWLQETTMTATLPLTDDREHQWPVVDVLKATEAMAEANPAYGKKLLEAVFRVGQETSIILYCDEATPGNPLASCVQRKAYLFYIGYKCMRPRPGSWITVAALPSNLLIDVIGGVAGATTVLLRALTPCWNGRTLLIAGQRIFCKLRLEAFSGDEAGLAACLAAKGASGRRPCWLCSNLISKLCRDQLLERGQANVLNKFVTIDEADKTKYSPATDTSIYAALDSLSACAAVETKGALEDLSKNLGWRHEPRGPLAQPELRSLLRPAATVFDVLQLDAM
ncbi:unnamed protein product [Symbiodinium natans]|uniref:Uncharacterized protein n=1 Tax=Symbiodinium natans TaxID=878477 RepID=A0A812RX07_9DINO|nr:unnamed protein product [Symbiodinium natans]